MRATTTETTVLHVIFHVCLSSSSSIARHSIFPIRTPENENKKVRYLTVDLASD